MFQNQYASSEYRHSSANYHQLPPSIQADQQKTCHLHGSSSNVSPTNHVSENSRARWQDSVTSNVHMVNKLHIQTNPQIASGLPIGTPKADKSNLEADSSSKPAYVCVSMPKNDLKAVAVQGGSEAVMQVTVGSIYLISQTKTSESLQFQQLSYVICQYAQHLQLYSSTY